MRIFTVLLMSASLGVQAQRIDYNKIILPKDAANISTEERLVQLAWDNNPIHKVLDHEIESAAFKKKKSSLVWLDNIGVNGNLNEFNIKSFTEGAPVNDDGRGNQFFPRYNVYARLPFSVFSEIPLNKKIAVRDLEIAKERQNLAKLEIRARVLTAYEEYQRTEKLFRIAEESEQNEQTNFVVKEQKYKLGQLTYQEYADASRDYLERQMQKVNAESNFKKARIDLEEIIGVALSEVL